MFHEGPHQLESSQNKAIQGLLKISKARLGSGTNVKADALDDDYTKSHLWSLFDQADDSHGLGARAAKRGKMIKKNKF